MACRLRKIVSTRLAGKWALRLADLAVAILLAVGWHQPLSKT